MGARGSDRGGTRNSGKGARLSGEMRGVGAVSGKGRGRNAPRSLTTIHLFDGHNGEDTFFTNIGGTRRRRSWMRA